MVDDLQLMENEEQSRMKSQRAKNRSIVRDSFRLTKQSQPRPICVTCVSKGPALVNDKTDAVELGELEHKIKTETLSFNNVQSQRKDYWQDLEIVPKKDVRLQANDNNKVDQSVDDCLDMMDINTDDQNVETTTGNSQSYYFGPELHGPSVLTTVVVLGVDGTGQESKEKPVDIRVDTTVEGNAKAAIDARVETAVEGVADATVDT
ncbi:hypothetical protein Fot_35546 [Forsythia ovata]|uniref:Uncharacterized protein n=1 Tax=Forsythia ovata TaxID=205694 RepID=A0ABD1SPN6_9LAMI